MVCGPPACLWPTIDDNASQPVKPKRFSILWICVVAVEHGVGLVWATGQIPAWGHCYSASPFYRAQVAPTLRGELAVSRNLEHLTHDLCWSEGGVQQVWGLGKPLWRIPFTLMARLAGFEHLPDFLAQAAALALTAWWVLKTARGLFNKWPPNLPDGPTLLTPLGAPVLPLFYPPFLHRPRTRFHVWEEAVAYEYLVGISLGAGLIRLGIKPSFLRHLGICLLPRLGLRTRPTPVFHTGAAVLAGAIGFGWANGTNMNHQRRSGSHPWRRTLGPLWIGSLPWWTGTVSDQPYPGRRRICIRAQTECATCYWCGLCHALRPFIRIGTVVFGRPRVIGSSVSPEVLQRSALVCDRTVCRTVADDSLGRGRQHHVRSRILGLDRRVLRRGNLCPPPFDTCLGGKAPTVCTHGDPWHTMRDRVLALLTVDSPVATESLAGFYLRDCVISTRYALDFMPAFAAAMVVGWLPWIWAWKSHRRGYPMAAVSLGVLVAWISIVFLRSTHSYRDP